MSDSAPIPVVLDVDTGYDDALALLLALRSPRLRVLGITCVVGNQRLERVVANTLKILDVVGAPDIPVAAGMELPLVEGLRVPMALHGQDGMADLGLPCSSRRVVDVHAVELLRHIVAETRDPVMVIALAPLTNVAIFLRMYPQLARQLAGMTVMGGTYADIGNTSPVAEFNIRHDPEAAAIVLSSGLPIRLYPLDIFRRISFSREEIGGLVADPDPAAQTAGRILRHACDFFAVHRALIGDAGAVAAVIDPAGVSTQRLPVSVELAGGSRGQTVVDRRPANSRQRLDDWWSTSLASADVVIDVHVARYKELFRGTLCAHV